jgi:hypothetical protein
MADESIMNEDAAVGEENSRASRLVRLGAILVLIPSVPGLLAAVAALAFFYSAPERFGALIARLPGSEFIRTALIFAPATLFAVVVLAVLYARQPQPVPQPHPGPPAATVGWVTAARWGLVPVVPLSIIAVGVWVLSFVIPERFDRLLERLPATPVLTLAVHWGPLILLLATVVLLAVALRPAGGASVAAGATGRWLRWSVGIILFSAVPLLVISLGALGLSVAAPAFVDNWLARFPADTFTRLVLLFAPIILLALVVLAILYLAAAPSDMNVTRPPLLGARPEEARARIAIWVLGGGLVLTSVTTLGLLATVVVLILR